MNCNGHAISHEYHVALCSSFKVLTFITLQFGLVSLAWAFDLCKSIVFLLELNDVEPDSWTKFGLGWAFDL